MSTQAKQIVVVVLAIVVVGFVVWMGRPQAAGPAQTYDTRQSTVPSSAKAVDQKLEQQIADLQDKIQKNPKDAESLIDLGNVFFDTQQYARAADTYNLALDLDPSNAGVRTDLGLSYFFQGMTNTAIKEYRQAIQTDPKSVEAHYNLALALSHGNPPDIDGAITEWQQVIKLAPDGEPAKKSQTFIDSFQKQQK